ncbi:MAG: putative GntR family transcriptional regulator [Bacilli bacterium]|nr:putative GntR family transcriptional regulator [Bacilli bacterium]
MTFDNTLLYHKIKLFLREEILNKTASDTEIRLDAERKMAEDLGVSRSSINKAISELTAEGFLIKRRGKGVFIPTKEQLAVKESQLNTIALLLPDTNDYFYAEISREIEKIAFEYGIHIMFCLIGRDPEKERSFLNSVLQKRFVKGIIAVPHLSSENLSIYRKLNQTGFPVVLINRIHETMKDLPHVVYDQGQGAYEGVHHLFQTGRGTMLFIGDERDGYQSYLRKTGFDRALQELGRGDGFELYGNEDHFEDKLVQMIERSHIDGVIAYNDIIATRAMNVLINHGFHIPKDVAVIGFDNSQLADIAMVPLTSVRFAKKKLANLAFDTIFHLIRGESCETTHILSTSLEIRNSTKDRDSCNG